MSYAYMFSGLTCTYNNVGVEGAQFHFGAEALAEGASTLMGTALTKYLLSALIGNL